MGMNGVGIHIVGVHGVGVQGEALQGVCFMAWLSAHNVGIQSIGVPIAWGMQNNS
jgi:hypothetical protein